MSGIGSFPFDMKNLIFSYFDQRELTQVTPSVCKEWRALSLEDRLWNVFIKKACPEFDLQEKHIREAPCQKHHSSKGIFCDLRYFWNRGPSPSLKNLDAESAKALLIDRVCRGRWLGKCQITEPIENTLAKVTENPLFRELKATSSPLNVLLSSDQYEAFELFLAAGFNIFQRDRYQNTPLHEAAYKCNLHVTQRLLSLQSDPNAKNHCENAPINLLLNSEYLVGNREGIVEIALKIIKRLVEKGADLQHKNSNGHTYLHHVSLRNFLPIAEFLIQCKVDIDQTNIYHQTALIEAIRNCAIKVALYLINAGARLDILNYEKKSAFYYAVYNQDEDMCRLLVTKGVSLKEEIERGVPLLSVACQSGLLEWVKLLIVEGANPHATDEGGESVLHLAAMRNRTEIIRFLVKTCRMKVDIELAGGMTPLHAAIGAGKSKAVEVLLNLGARRDKIAFGRTALELAYRHKHRDDMPKIIELLQ